MLLLRCVELIASGSNLSISFRSNIWSIYNPSPCTIGILNLLFKDASSITLYKNSGIISNRLPDYKLWFWWNILKTGLDTDPRLCIFAAHAFAPPLYNVQLLLIFICYDLYPLNINFLFMLICNAFCARFIHLFILKNIGIII